LRVESTPYLIVDGASQRIVNGSLIVFALMFVAALVLGRAWCGWACPVAGLQEVLFAVRDNPARGGKLDWIKWAIWIPWVGLIVAMVVMAGGYRAVNPLHSMEDGLISADRLIPHFVIYYGIVGLVVILSLTAGRRAFCHYVCWMAPFMIIGRKIRNLLAWPALRLKPETDKCVKCQQCTETCPMSLAVQDMVLAGAMERTECILCGNCVDICPKDAIRYSFGGGK